MERHPVPHHQILIHYRLAIDKLQHIVQAIRIESRVLAGETLAVIRDRDKKIIVGIGFNITAFETVSAAYRFNHVGRTVLLGIGLYFPHNLLFWIDTPRLLGGIGLDLLDSCTIRRELVAFFNEDIVGCRFTQIKVEAPVVIVRVR